MEQKAFPPEAASYLAYYRSSLPQRQEIGMIIRAMDMRGTDAPACLDIGLPNPVMSLLLRERGGRWGTVAGNESLSEQAAGLLKETVPVLDSSGELPWEDGSFERVVVARDILGGGVHPDEFIKECHRVLKPEGKLVLSVRHIKGFSIVNRLAPGIPAGYTEGELFHLLKTGFDVLSTSTYSRFFVELVRIWETRALASKGDPTRIRKKAALLYGIADQFDYFGRGHALAAVCRRRQWRPRMAPILKDGRKIHEAVLERLGS